MPAPHTSCLSPSPARHARPLPAGGGQSTGRGITSTHLTTKSPLGNRDGKLEGEPSYQPSHSILTTHRVPSSTISEDKPSPTPRTPLRGPARHPSSRNTSFIVCVSWGGCRGGLQGWGSLLAFPHLTPGGCWHPGVCQLPPNCTPSPHFTSACALQDLEVHWRG